MNTPGVVTRLRAGRPRNRDSISDSDKSVISFASVQTGSGARPAFYLIVPGVKPPGRQRDSSGPCDADVKNEWGGTFSHVSWDNFGSASVIHLRNFSDTRLI